MQCHSGETSDAPTHRLRAKLNMLPLLTSRCCLAEQKPSAEHLYLHCNARIQGAFWTTVLEANKATLGRPVKER